MGFNSVFKGLKGRQAAIRVRKKERKREGNDSETEDNLCHLSGGKYWTRYSEPLGNTRENEELRCRRQKI